MDSKGETEKEYPIQIFQKEDRYETKRYMNDHLA
jgi:hypothetical protein